MARRHGGRLQRDSFGLPVRTRAHVRSGALESLGRARAPTAEAAGRPAQVEYLNWSPGEPNEYGGAESGEDFVHQSGEKSE